jgi:phthiocerol/phenolphthiocerol synthesis type-I polyketide synthase E
MTDPEIQDPLEGVAVVGLAGRFPGARNLEELWRNLQDGVESISFFSDRELEEAGVEPALLARPEFVKAAGALEDIELFDADFFGFSAREASIMEPQYRLFLESAAEALQNAGYDAESYDGAVGVYAGMSVGKYLMNNLASNREILEWAGDLQLRIYNDKDFLASLTAYKLNLRGPSLSVQTACSTSLVAICLASQALLNYQCDMALAGGVSVSSPARFGYKALAGVFSPDGHCRAFDADAQGTVHGNGVGVVVLKRLADAVADGDTISAVIKGFAINNDGAHKVGYTAPSVDGQAEVIAMAQAMAGVDPETVTCIEAHGTGTPLGDPIEIAALTQVFRQSTDRTGFCAVGSVKTNFGHLDAAAGVASFLKTVLALEHRMLPPSLHFRRPNPQMDLASTPFFVNASLREWNPDGVPRRAGVSAFAVGGVNAHVVVEEAPAAEPSGPSRPWQLLVLSARTETALEAATDNLAGHLERHPERDLADVAFTLQAGRRAYAYRRALVCRDREEALRILRGRDGRRLWSAAPEDGQRPVAFLFPGLGNQYPDMALELYRSETVFRETVDRCAGLLAPHLGQDLRDLLFPGRKAGAGAGPAALALDLRRMVRGGPQGGAAGPLAPTWIAQPALFVLEYALAKLWMEWGLRPQALAGYSIGEYAAACIAGVFRLEDALALVARRARMIEELPGGAMLAVSLGEEEIAPWVTPGLSLAAVNGPTVCVLAGPEEEIAAVEARLHEGGVVCRSLETTHAFHSRMLEPIVAPFRRLLEGIELSAPAIPLISDVTGTWLTPEQATDPGYWAEHLCSTVRFGDAVAELWRSPNRALLEMGAGQALSAWALQHPAASRAADPVAVGSLRHSLDAQPDLAFLLGTLGKLWLAGVRFDARAFWAGERRRRVPLPTYPFERRRYWIDPQKPRREAERPREVSLEKRPDVGDWFYVPAWRQSLPPSSPDLGEVPGGWLLFCDELGLGERLARRLEEEGRPVVKVLAGEIFSSPEPGWYTLPADDPAAYARLWSELRHAGELPRRIVHLWSVTGAGAAPEEIRERGFYSLLFLAQALGEREPGADIDLAVISNGLRVVTGEEEAQPEKATLLGPCQVIPQEIPHLRCRSIDVSWPSGLREAELVERLLAELTAEAAEPVAWRGLTRWVQTFEPVRLTEGRSRLRDQGVYLITGGLGGIGLVLAERLARAARARLALVGRSPFPAREEWEAWLTAHGEADDVSRKIRHLQSLEALGAEVLVASVDATDTEGLRAVRERVRQRFGGIHGVIHAAGVPPGGLIQLKERDKAAAVLAPKVEGTLALANVFGDLALDFFVLCSSLNSLYGVFGLVDHCAANAFLDAFAQARFARGETAVLAVNWDAWLQVGQAAQAGQAFARQDRGPLPAGEPGGHPLLDVLLAGEDGRAALFVSRFGRGRWVIDEHRVQGRGVVPGTAHLEMARAALERHAGVGPAILEHVSFLRPLLVPEGEERDVRVALAPEGEGYGFRIESAPAGTDPRSADGWSEHATGRLRRPGPEPSLPARDVEDLKRRCSVRPWGAADPQPERDPQGPIWFGPRWQGALQGMGMGDGEGLAAVELAEEHAGDLGAFALHPALLDVATGPAQLLGEGYHLPLGYERIVVRGPLPRRIYSHVRRQPGAEGSDLITCDLSILSESGQELVEVRGYMLRRVRPSEAAPAVPVPETHPAAGLSRLYDSGIEPEEGAEVLERILASGLRLPQLLVSTKDFPAVLERARSRSGAVLSEIRSLQTVAEPHPRPNLRTTYTEPRNDLEARLAQVWRELLGLEGVGIHDNFFELGGDSLLAIRLLSKIDETFGVELSLRAIFAAPTVAELGVAIVQRQAEEADESSLAAAIAEIQQLSPEELMALLEEEKEMEVEGRD